MKDESTQSGRTNPPCSEAKAFTQESLNRTLIQLVAKTCQHPRGSRQRNRNLTQLIRTIIRSGKLWRERTDYYEDALQQTWIYLSRNLCEALTGGQYDPRRSSVTTWLNQYLKRRLQDFRLEEQDEKYKRLSPQSTGAKNAPDPVEILQSPPDIPPIWEETLRWAETDPDGELTRIHIKGRPDLTCQVLILRRLPPETDWKTLEAEFDCSYSTLASFYQRQCVPRLRQFAELQGYL